MLVTIGHFRTWWLDIPLCDIRIFLSNCKTSIRRFMWYIADPPRHEGVYFCFSAFRLTSVHTVRGLQERTRPGVHDHLFVWYYLIWWKELWVQRPGVHKSATCNCSFTLLALGFLNCIKWIRPHCLPISSWIYWRLRYASLLPGRVCLIPIASGEQRNSTFLTQKRGIRMGECKNSEAERKLALECGGLN